jgi:hypothetical protein
MEVSSQLHATAPFPKEVEFETIGWIHLARLGTSEHSNEPSGSVKGGELRDWGTVVSQKGLSAPWN